MPSEGHWEGVARRSCSGQFLTQRRIDRFAEGLAEMYGKTRILPDRENVAKIIFQNLAHGTPDFNAVVTIDIDLTDDAMRQDFPFEPCVGEVKNLTAAQGFRKTREQQFFSALMRGGFQEGQPGIFSGYHGQFHASDGVICMHGSRFQQKEQENPCTSRYGETFRTQSRANNLRNAALPSFCDVEPERHSRLVS